MIRELSAHEVAGMLGGVPGAGQEFALLDLREIVDFGTGHPLLATNVPLSCLELRIGTLVPRADTPTVVLDGGGGSAQLGAERLARMGYSEVSVLRGGAPAWAAAGQALYPEIEVPTKGFGGFARHHGRPTFIEPHDLDRALRSAEDWIVLDARPRGEYRNGSIPGSIDAPGADVLRCFADLVPDPATRVVVNCMSATRGILGGLSLVAAGVPNPVHVLHHGTRGWQLEGLALESGASRFPEPPSPAAIRAAQASVDRMAERAGIARIDPATLAVWRADSERTTYLFDVRTPSEFATSHLPGSRNVPEGALVMSPDRHFATLGSRIVLIDDDRVRATITALWLAQMGWGEVAVLDGGLRSDDLVGSARDGVGDGTDPAPIPAAVPASVSAGLDPEALAALRAREPVRIIDVGTSEAYLSGHLPDAIWCSRVRLSALLARETHSGPTVLTSSDGVLAGLAASDLDSGHPVQMLAGGNAAWRDAGRALTSEPGRLTGPRDDHWLAASERPGEVRRNVVDYLQWEVQLLEDIERGGRVPYRNLLWR